MIDAASYALPDISWLRIEIGGRIGTGFLYSYTIILNNKSN
jgi:hypothetical protein